jgi:hypothetical protein
MAFTLVTPTYAEDHRYDVYLEIEKNLPTPASKRPSVALKKETNNTCTIERNLRPVREAEYLTSPDSAMKRL